MQQKKLKDFCFTSNMIHSGKNACQFQSKGTIFSAHRTACAGGNIHCLPKACQNILQKLSYFILFISLSFAT